MAKLLVFQAISYFKVINQIFTLLVCSRRPSRTCMCLGLQGVESVFKVHSAGHPLKRGGT